MKIRFTRKTRIITGAAVVALLVAVGLGVSLPGLISNSALDRIRQEGRDVQAECTDWRLGAPALFGDGCFEIIFTVEGKEYASPAMYTEIEALNAALRGQPARTDGSRAVLMSFDKKKANRVPLTYLAVFGFAALAAAAFFAILEHRVAWREKSKTP